MSKKLAAKHKNSLALQTHVSPQETSNSKSYSVKSRPFQLILFPIITACIFVGYWLILCPLLFNSLYNQNATRKDKWPVSWPLSYWLVALLLWILVMIILTVIWRSLKSKYTKLIKQKSYGSEDPAATVYLRSVSPKNYQPDTELKAIKNKDILHGSDTEREKGISVNKGLDESSECSSRLIKKHKDLPPLVIHRRMSGEDIENTGVINVQEESNDCSGVTEEKDKDDNSSEKGSMTNYLKLVTVTPSEDETDLRGLKSGPLSPRELFFIDLIREAEKAEQKKETSQSEPRDRKHFFPKDFSTVTETDKSKNIPGKTLTDRTESAEVAHESSYFIANVESPLTEKTEVFLEITPEAESMKTWKVNLNSEKPTVTLETCSDFTQQETADGNSL